jgi:hypothetical protein
VGLLSGTESVEVPHRPKERSLTGFPRAPQSKQWVVRSFFDRVGGQVQKASTDLSNEDLEAAHRTVQVMIQSIKDFRTP